MKRVYRFSADLRQKPPAPPREGRVQDDELKRNGRLDAELVGLGPARLLEVSHDDPLDAQELLQAYNGSLRRAQTLACGRYESNAIDHHVFYDEWDNKHVITQPLARTGERISELMVSMDGHLRRLSFERMAGPLLDWQHLMLSGLSELNDSELKAAPGYWLLTTHFYREGEFLVRVEQTQQHYSPQLGDFEHIDDVILG